MAEKIGQYGALKETCRRIPHVPDTYETAKPRWTRAGPGERAQGSAAGQGSRDLLRRLDWKGYDAAWRCGV